ncbi:MAG: glycosyltransferase family 87 protein [Terriglobales bacterium]
MRPGIFRKPICFLVAATLGAASMWIYAYRILIPYQKADAAAHGRPRGNLSDLYPRWLGAKELLLRGRDPYSAEVTRDIQAGYYGRTLDASQPNDPHDQQGFAYPVYVAFLLAPTIGFDFATVREGFFALLTVLAIVSTMLWLRVVRWAVPRWTEISLLVLTAGSITVMQGLKLQQITVLVAGLVAMAIALIIADWAIAAGIVLAFATIKPQLVFLLLLWLTFWTLGDWRRRYRWAASFLATMAILIAASEWYLPDWIPQFWRAAREYQRYTGAMSVIDRLTRTSASGAVWGHVLEVLVFAVVVAACWKERRQPASHPEFGFMIGMVLAVTVLLIPTFAPYNQVLLIPAVLLLIKERVAIWRKGLSSRVLMVVTAVLILWPWLASIALVVLSFVLPLSTVERGWAIPFWTVTQIPVGVAALMLVHYYQRTFTASPGPGSS